jgi:hypothetical protein
MKPKSIVAIFIASLLVSCLSLPAHVPTETAVATDTFDSLFITVTPSPTFTTTPTPTPSETPIPTKTFAPVPSERPEGDLISGTYKFDRGDGGYCVIRAVLQPFVMPHEEVAIELFCMRGPPSYNSGYASPQKVILSNNLAVYSVPEEIFHTVEEYADAPCHFVFQFDKDTIKVTQLGTDFSCGFGHAVYADGVYKLVDPKPPVLGCLSIWDACSALYPIP